MAELSGKPEPQLFHHALARFEDASRLMGVLDKKLGELADIMPTSSLDPTFAASMERILLDHQPLERVSMTGVRFANIGQGRATRVPTPFGRSLGDIMKSQRDDLQIVRKQLRETIEAFRVVLPAADKGEFAALMLSGRAGFADKIQQAVDQIQVFAQFYTRSCMTTIAATMQAYPAGLKWLKDSLKTPNPAK
jgi:hypothetical protein